MKIAAIMCLVLGVVVASQAMYVPEKASNELDARIDWKKLLKPILDKVKTLGVAAVRKLLIQKGVPSAIIDAVLGGIGKREADPQTALGKILQRLLEKYIAVFKDLVDQGKAQYQQVLDKAKVLLEELNENATGALEKVKKFIQDTIKNLLPQGPGYAVDDEMLTVMSAMDMELDAELEAYGILQNIKDTIKNIVDKFSGQFSDLRDFLLNVVKDTQNQLRPHVDNIKDLAKEFVENANKASDKVKLEAKKFFEQHKQDLGDLWQKVKDAVKDVQGKREADPQTALGQILQRLLEKYIAVFKDLVDQGKVKYQQVLDKARELLEELNENATGALEKVKQFIQNTLKNLLPQGPGYAVDGEVAVIMAAMDVELDDELEAFGILQNIKDTIKNIVDKFSGQFSDLRDFLLNVVKDTQNQLRPHVDNIKDLAKEFVENANKASDKVKQEAKKFFEQHKQDLGDLWQKVKDAVKDVQGNKREVAFEGPSTLVGQILERLLEKYIAIFKDLVDQGKTKYTQILEKAKALLEELNENATGAIEKVKQFIQNTLKNLLPQGPGYAMDDEMVAVMVAMDDEYQTILGKILSNMLQKYIQKLKELVAHGKNKYQEILDKAQQLAGELEGHSSGILDKVKQFLEIVKGVISGNAGDEVDYDLAVEYGIIDSIRDTIRGIINHLKGKFNDLKNFFLQTLKDTHGQLKPHLDNIKDLAKDFIDHATAATDGVKDQALKFFNQYKNDLGLLWKQVQDAAKHVHGQITGF